MLDVNVFKDGLIENPANISDLFIFRVNDNLAILYDSNEYILEFHPTVPDFTIEDEFRVCILFSPFRIFETNVNVP